MTEESFDIEYLTRLARLNLSDVEKSQYSQQLAQVMDFMKRLDSVDTEGVEPTAHANPIYNVLAEDIKKPGLSQQQALMNAPAQREGQFVVPKVVEDA